MTDFLAASWDMLVFSVNNDIGLYFLGFVIIIIALLSFNRLLRY